jgi:hypothetical protein
MQWGLATVVPVIDICDMFGKDTGSCVMSTHEGTEYRSHVVVVPVASIRTMVKEDLDNCYMPTLRRQMQWCLVEAAPGIDICTVREEEPNNV